MDKYKRHARRLIGLALMPAFFLAAGAARAEFPEKPVTLVLPQEALGISVISDGRIEAAAHRKFVEGEVARWAKVIQAAGAYAD